MSIALPGLDLNQIMLLGARNRMAEHSPWHEESNLSWNWHASSLGDCSRAQCLKRRGLDLDGHTEEAQAFFDLGSWWHRRWERDCLLYEEAEPRFKVHAVEAGGRHPNINLKARMDMLFSWDGNFVVLDVKTEQSFARKHRVDDAERLGLPYAYKVQHQIQVATGAVIAESLIPGLRIHSGRIFYINKNSLAVDQVPVPITDTDREWVCNRVQNLEDMYAQFEASNWKQLPPQLHGCSPDDTWKCKPRSKDDPRGMYCPSRQACMAFAGLGL